MTYGASGSYNGLDQWGRIVDQLWANDSSVAKDDYKYAYDAAGNVRWKQNLGPSASHKDELYAYDEVYRLIGTDRGDLVFDDPPGDIHIDNSAFQQDWTLDGMGNFDTFDDNGSIQDREHNAANELQSITPQGGATKNMDHDAAGNLIDGYALKYDAWNRLAKVTDASNTVAEYQYDAISRRVVKKTYTSGTLSQTRHFYLSADNQVLEERGMAGAAAFGATGKVSVDFAGGWAHASAMAIQGDGKIVVAGWVEIDDNYDFALTRYNPDGTLDTTFGEDGRVQTDFDEDWDQANSVAIQADGKIVAAGFAWVDEDCDFALARYNADGTPDTTFGTGGKAYTGFDGGWDQINSVVIQSDGKIVAAGRAAIDGDDNFALARYESNGTLDGDFDGDQLGNGKIYTGFDADYDEAFSVAIDEDGKIIAAGYATIDNDHDFALARYEDDGTLDTSFGGDGRVTTDFNGGWDEGACVAIQDDGQILVGGAATVNGNYNFALARYDELDGDLDETFGTGGRKVTQVSATYDGIWSLAIQGDGKILAAGCANISNNDYALARYESNGTLDGDFGTAGVVTTDFDAGTDAGLSVALQVDGRIVVAGPAIVDSNGVFALARYKPGGVLDEQSEEEPATAHQYVWSPRYVDAAVCRDTYVDGDLSAEDRVYYLSDANFNVTALVDTSGAVVERYVYTPYGKVTVCSESWTALTPNASTVGNTVLYTGRELDMETGLQYNRARYYDADLGRFVGRDPLEYAAQDMNLYRYVGGAPVGLGDPSGMTCLDKRVVPCGLRECQIVLFFGHHVPTRTSPENEDDVESVVGWDQIEGALVRMVGKMWLAKGGQLPEGGLYKMTLDQAIALSKQAGEDFLPKNAFIAGVGCFPESLKQTVNDLFPGRWLPGAPVFADGLTLTKDNVSQALKVFKAAQKQGEKWCTEKTCTSYTIHIYSSAEFSKAIQEKIAELTRAKENEQVKEYRALLAASSGAGKTINCKSGK